MVFVSKGLGKPRHDRGTQSASTAVERSPYHVHLHPGISQRQCQRERRFSLAPPFAYDGPRPQWPLQSYSIRRRSRLLHPLVRPTLWRTFRRACQLRWAGALRPELWVGWAHALPSRSSRFSHTRAPNEGGRPRFSIWTIRCPCSFSRPITRYPLGISCKRMRQRSHCRFRFCVLPPMARTTTNTPCPPRFHTHCLTTIHRTLAR